MNLMNRVKATRHSNAVAAGQTDITPSAGIDMQGFEGIVFLVPMGAITASAVTSIKVQQSDAAASGFADLAGTSVSIADDDDNKIAWVEVHRPLKRYVRLIVDRGTADAVVDGIIALQYGEHKLPTVQDATTVIAGEIHASPAEGTA